MKAETCVNLGIHAFGLALLFSPIWAVYACGFGLSLWAIHSYQNKPEIYDSSVYTACSWWLILILAGAFSKWVPFSNDGPLGQMLNRQVEQPEAFYAIWADSNWLGDQAPTAGPNFSVALMQCGAMASLPIIFAVAWWLYRNGWFMPAFLATLFLWSGIIIAHIASSGQLFRAWVPWSGLVFVLAVFAASFSTIQND